MFPISDDNSDHHLRPYVNYVLIAINVLVFVFLQGMGSNIGFTYAFSTVPAEILSGNDIITNEIIRDPESGQQFEIGLRETPVHVWFTLITSMFMHGGWGHLLGNMLYLWIFGDNIENRLGHGKYLFFYLLTGIIASLCHVFSTSILGGNTLIPSLGASGAISGVLGGYIVLFPRRKVNVLLLRFIVAVPAIVALGFWIILQVVSSAGVLGGSGGVAYAAHIGGFIAGAILIKIFDFGTKLSPNQPVQQPRRRVY
jgi:membrane associated rhomboid family serine protease